VEPLRAAIVLLGGILGCIATAVGIYTSLKSRKAEAKADEEANRLKEKSGAIDALQTTVSRQQEVITGLAQGLKDCITRDNEKAQSIQDLRHG
jgi:Zn-dependent protease with chaperone function